MQNKSFWFSVITKMTLPWYKNVYLYIYSLEKSTKWPLFVKVPPVDAMFSLFKGDLISLKMFSFVVMLIHFLKIEVC